MYHSKDDTSYFLFLSYNMRAISRGWRQHLKSSIINVDYIILGYIRGGIDKLQEIR